jgi:hypothetical protein
MCFPIGFATAQALIIMVLFLTEPTKGQSLIIMTAALIFLEILAGMARAVPI